MCQKKRHFQFSWNRSTKQWWTNSWYIFTILSESSLKYLIPDTFINILHYFAKRKITREYIYISFSDKTTQPIYESAGKPKPWVATFNQFANHFITEIVNMLNTPPSQPPSFPLPLSPSLPPFAHKVLVEAVCKLSYAEALRGSGQISANFSKHRGLIPMLGNWR